jgi:hypothetical protein
MWHGVTIATMDKRYHPEGEEEWSRSATHASRHVQGGLDELDGNDLFVSGTSAPSTPSAGDRYFNTTLAVWLVYDGTREKWLSEAAFDVHFGGNDIAAGSYYASSGITMTATLGIPATKGTVVGVSWGRTDSDTAQVEVVETNGSATSVLGNVESTAAGVTTSSTVDWDFDKGMLSVRNKSGGNTTSNVIGVIRYRMRA